MDDGGWLGRFFQTFGLRLAAWTALLMVGVHWFKARSERLRDTHAQGGAEYDRIAAERDRYHDLLVECQAERAALLSRAIVAEATLMGMGKANQEAQRIVAVERLIDATKKDGTGNDK